MEKQDALKKAVSLAGGQSALAGKITDILRAQGKLDKRKKISQGHVWYWIKTKKTPTEYVSAISQAVNNKVTKSDLRPDIYGAQ